MYRSSTIYGAGSQLRGRSALMSPGATLSSVTPQAMGSYPPRMKDAMSTRDLVGLALAIYTTLLGVGAWMVHMIRRGPHPEIHLRGRWRGTGGRR